MPITIGTNIASLNAQRRLSLSSDQLASTFERLSSGQRINRASDDAAGLAISVSLKTNVRIFTQSVRNINDGISAISIAESATDQLSQVLTRISELSTQAASGTFSYKQRTAMDAEAQALRKEFNRVVATTSFNGVKLLTGSNTTTRIEAGDSGATNGINIGVSSLGVSTANNGTFNLLSSGNLSYYPGENIFGDFNNDGKIDLIGAGTFSSDYSVQIGNGDGTFTAPTVYTNGLTMTTAKNNRTGDFNGDGNLDFALTFQAGPTRFFLGNGNGTFKAGISIASSGQPLEVLDVNRDGFSDIITLESSVITVSLNNGNGTFKANQTLAGGGVVYAFNKIDLNDDGVLDLYWVDTVNANKVNTAIGNSDGSFKASIAYDSTVSNVNNDATRAIDINGDGKLDLVVNNNTTNGVSTLFGNGDGTFRAAVSFSIGTGDYLGDAADLNGDGRGDLLMFNGRVLLGNGDGTFSNGSAFAGGAPAGVYDVDRDGAVDVIANSNLYKGSGSGSSFLQSFSLLSRSEAYATMQIMDRAMTNLQLSRGNFGAQQSRLQTARNVLEVTKQNLSAANSQILDADMAQEAASLTVSQIGQQAAIAVLSQANQQPALVLSLLRN